MSRNNNNKKRKHGGDLTTAPFPPRGGVGGGGKDKKRPKPQPQQQRPVSTTSSANLTPNADPIPALPLASPSSPPTKDLITTAFTALHSSLASLLSAEITDDALHQVLPEDKANFVTALSAMKASGELSWLSTPAIVTTSVWPPPLPAIKNPFLLEQAFTHRSFISGESVSNPGTENQHYERLEFLGDSYLQSISSHLLFNRFPQYREGPLSEMRQQLVANKPLNYYASLYNMQLRLRGGKGQVITSDPDSSMKVLADCFEAYIGALIVDNQPNEIGIKIVENWLAALFEPKIKEMETQRKGIAPVDKMAKNSLHAFAGGASCKLDYRWTDGLGGNKGGFWITIFLTGWGFKEKKLAFGWGSTKLDAQLRAAMNTLADNKLVEEITKAKEMVLGGPKPPPEVLAEKKLHDKKA